MAENLEKRAPWRRWTSGEMRVMKLAQSGSDGGRSRESVAAGGGVASVGA